MAAVRTSAAFMPDDFFGIPPAHYGVFYVINKDMRGGIRVFAENPEAIRANVHEGWCAGRDHITGLGHPFTEGEPHPDHPDHVFATDHFTAMIREDGSKVAIVSRMRHKERQNETIEAVRMLENAGYSVIPSDCVWEGGDVRYYRKNGYWKVSVGDRTDPGAGKQLSIVSGKPALEVMTHHHYYHLDTRNGPLDAGHLIWVPHATSKAEQMLIEQLYAPDERLGLSPEVAKTYLANTKSLARLNENGTVSYDIPVPHNAPGHILEKLEQWDYRIVKFDLSGLKLAGGWWNCCFNQATNLMRPALQSLPENFVSMINDINTKVRPHRRLSYWVDGVLQTHNPRMHAVRGLQPRFA